MSSRMQLEQSQPGQKKMGAMDVRIEFYILNLVKFLSLSEQIPSSEIVIPISQSPWEDRMS